MSRGEKLGTGFLLDDRKVGYDIYCTDWEGLCYDAKCHHAQIAKLMDSQIVYVKKQEACERLLELRTKAERVLQSEERFQRVDELLEKAKIAYANACLYDDLGRTRVEAMGVLHYLLNAVMLYHGRYFKRGVKRTFEELAALPVDAQFADTIQKIVLCKEIGPLRELLKTLLLHTEQHTRREKKKTMPSDQLAGTYEEMYSNWRNKMEEAAAKDDVFSSYMNLCSLQFMLMELSDEIDIGNFNVMEEYNPDSLEDMGYTHLVVESPIGMTRCREAL